MVVWCTTTYAISAYPHFSCEFEPRSWWGVLDTTLRDIVCQWIAAGWWFSPALWFPPPVCTLIAVTTTGFVYEQEKLTRSSRCSDLYYHLVFSFVFTSCYFASSDGDLFRSILSILVFSFILWSNSQNPLYDGDSINMACYILIIHIIFQKSLTSGAKRGKKTETQSFLAWYYGNHRIYIEL